MTNGARRAAWGLVIAAGAGLLWLLTRGEELRPMTHEAPASVTVRGDANAPRRECCRSGRQYLQNLQALATVSRPSVDDLP